MSTSQLILASSSPQRRALLQQIGLEPVCIAADIDEARLANESAPDYVRRLSLEKCQVVAKAYPDAVVVGSDTTISIADRVLGKASDLEQAIETLSLLSDTQHSVFTGVAVASGTRHKVTVCETKVQFGVLTIDDIRDYWQTGEPQGKAGCYAIQGLGAVFVKAINGSYSNVVGLPLREVAALLAQFGMSVPGASSLSKDSF